MDKAKSDLGFIPNVKCEVFTSLVNRLDALVPIQRSGNCSTVDIISSWISSIPDDCRGNTCPANVSNHGAVRIRDHNSLEGTNGEQLIQGVDNIIKTTGYCCTVDSD